jgi:hypothetical protein
MIIFAKSSKTSKSLSFLLFQELKQSLDRYKSCYENDPSHSKMVKISKGPNFLAQLQKIRQRLKVLVSSPFKN